MIEVLGAGALTTVQDLGRPGWAHLGVPRSGAADRGALRLANRLVANGEGAAGLEATVRGPRLRVLARTAVAMTGALADANVDGETMPPNQALILEPGAILDVGPIRRGLRTYVAFAGGIDVPEVLGSSSTDTLGGLGRSPLRRGDRLRLLAARELSSSQQASSYVAPADDIIVTLLLGPRDDWISRRSLQRLSDSTYTVDASSNRVGVRLVGPPLTLARNGELRSEGVMPGALQVPPAGEPMILLADCPTTGGYPVLGVVPEEDLDRVAQLRPGGRVRFEPVGNPV